MLNRNMEENRIELKTITELLGLNFYIPEYQRGYRWTKKNVEQLLNDIWEYRQKPSNRNHFYCLQPLVVRKTRWQDLGGGWVDGFELIDGQQRITTLHRIITFLCKQHLRAELISEGYTQNQFNIYYKTRLESKDFLEEEESRRDKPDLYYMSEAYDVIKRWFEGGGHGMIARQVKEEMLKIILPSMTQNENGELLQPEWSVQVIWYEIKDENQGSEALFTRLNRGKIPLTSAELIKAKFVNSDSFEGMSEPEKIRRRTQLIQLWDEIENQLNNPKFWAFISNQKMEGYSNKIEYLFDISTKKGDGELDPLYSFIHFFEQKETAESLWAKWLKIEEIYRALMYWFTNKNLYHKVGYLIATGTTILDLVAAKRTCSKPDFESKLHTMIAAKIPENWEELSYGQSGKNASIIRVLLLANVELTRENGNSYEFFPFEWYKSITKSIEHIHAQNIEGISSIDAAPWRRWLHSHLGVLLNIANDPEKAKEIIVRVNAGMAQMKYADFVGWSNEILALVPKDSVEEYEYLHSIENLALLGQIENASLNNSIFEVKRQKVMDMDKNGTFIPLATKRIFLKYYADEHSRHYSTWTANERKEYLKDIQKAIQNYQPTNSTSHA